ncbi:hypothetical protein [Shewanella waksmanii]|uniref:hypothetical protein n=1 Tax=Shewanella waksmanii TaxID=213783 RepID=UPI0037355A66
MEQQPPNVDMPTQTTNTTTKANDDPVLTSLFENMDKQIVASFSHQQKRALSLAVRGQSWGKHSVDKRGTFAFPFVRWRFYYVFLLGRNRRAYTRREKNLSMLMFIAMVGGFLLISVMIGLLVLYLIKSAMGVDLFADSSTGIWDWFKSLF